MRNMALLVNVSRGFTAERRSVGVQSSSSSLFATPMAADVGLRSGIFASLSDPFGLKFRVRSTSGLVATEPRFVWSAGSAWRVRGTGTSSLTGAALGCSTWLTYLWPRSSEAAAVAKDSAAPTSNESCGADMQAGAIAFRKNVLPSRTP